MREVINWLLARRTAYRYPPHPPWDTLYFWLLFCCCGLLAQSPHQQLHPAISMMVLLVKMFWSILDQLSSPLSSPKVSLVFFFLFICVNTIHLVFPGASIGLNCGPLGDWDVPLQEGTGLGNCINFTQPGFVYFPYISITTNELSVSIWVYLHSNTAWGTFMKQMDEAQVQFEFGTYSSSPLLPPLVLTCN